MSPSRATRAGGTDQETMKEHEPQPHYPDYYRVGCWQEANERLEELAGDRSVSMGYGNTYNTDPIFVIKDALSGDGQGYYLREVQGGELGRTIVHIDINAETASKKGGENT